MIYFLLLILSNSIMVFFDVICFSFLVFEVHWNSWISWFIIFTKFGNSRLLVFPLFFFSYIFGDFSYTYIRSNEVIPHLTDDLCIFFNSFSLCFFLVSVAMSSSLLNFSFAIHNLIHPSSVFLISAIVVFIFRSLRLFIFSMSQLSEYMECHYNNFSM